MSDLDKVTLALWCALALMLALLATAAHAHGGHYCGTDTHRTGAFTRDRYDGQTPDGRHNYDRQRWTVAWFTVDNNYAQRDC